jgi:hypothetical protein
VSFFTPSSRMFSFSLIHFHNVRLVNHLFRNRAFGFSCHQFVDASETIYHSASLQERRIGYLLSTYRTDVLSLFNNRSWHYFHIRYVPLLFRVVVVKYSET